MSGVGGGSTNGVAKRIAATIGTRRVNMIGNSVVE
jgi:hypothetical protein